MATSNRNKKQSSGRSPTGAAKKTSKKAAGAAKKATGKAAKAPAKPKKAAGKATAGKKGAAGKGATAAKGGKPKGQKGAIAHAAGKKGGKKPTRKRGLEHPTTEPPPPPSSKRNFGLRGAAPWVARHAAKHAEELRKRNAEPPPPGSARATLRVPPQAEQIKSQISQLHQLTSQVRNLRKRLDKTFFEIGELLAQVQLAELHVAKGYASFESFLDREIDLPRTLALKLIRISHTFQKETAYDFGLERLSAALSALDGELPQAAPSHPSSRGFSSAALPPKPPPIRYDE